jgi:glutamine amidotransferase
MISVIDYGVANLGSMLNMLARIGAEGQRISTPEEVMRATKLILPGIGAFDHGMAALRERGLVEPLTQRVLRDGIPLLGVCLGMQLLGNSSEEGSSSGLGFIKARSVRFDPAVSGIRVPHMGWQTLVPKREHPILAGIDAHSRFYFVHSYHVVCEDPQDVLATAEYGIEFTAMVNRGNIIGAQFHPEKSHRFGMRVLKSFVEL